MSRYPSILAALAVTVAAAREAYAHCDTTKGPVVAAARAALEAEDVNLVLPWVGRDDEATIRSSFQEALAVRKLGPAARQLADRHFFETLVRIHRAGEGAPYTGLTDADPEPFVAQTDVALKKGSVAELEEALVTTVRAGLADRFEEARAASLLKTRDVAHGRAFVAAYVALLHWVEGVATAAAQGHHEGESDGHPAAAKSVGPPAGGPGATNHIGGAFQSIPWILAGALALAALIEGAILWRRHRHAAA